jgi:hypothetical protein
MGAEKVVPFIGRGRGGIGCCEDIIVVWGEGRGERGERHGERGFWILKSLELMGNGGQSAGGIVPVNLHTHASTLTYHRSTGRQGPHIPQGLLHPGAWSHQGFVKILEEQRQRCDLKQGTSRYDPK